MKKLTKIELLLTILVVIDVAAMARTAAWMTKMSYSDPAREHLLHTWISPVADILWYITFFPWLIFTVIYLFLLFLHLSAWVLRKLTNEDSK